jgi:hypothetical protein
MRRVNAGRERESKRAKVRENARDDRHGCNKIFKVGNFRSKEFIEILQLIWIS